MKTPRTTRAPVRMAAPLLLCVAAAAGAHTPAPERVVAEMNAPALRERFGVVEVAPHPELSRLLVVRVDAGRWRGAGAGERRAAAEAWRRRWRQSVPDGLLAIVSAEGGDSLVSFDARGRARLRQPPAPRPQPRRERPALVP